MNKIVILSPFVDSETIRRISHAGSFEGGDGGRKK
jgi:hypothetical protein